MKTNGLILFPPHLRAKNAPITQYENTYNFLKGELTFHPPFEWTYGHKNNICFIRISGKTNMLGWGRFEVSIRLWSWWWVYLISLHPTHTSLPVYSLEINHHVTSGTLLEGDHYGALIEKKFSIRNWRSRWVWFGIGTSSHLFTSSKKL